MTEEWKPVVGYEQFYEVSSLGHVRSHDRVTVRSDGVVARFKGRVLRPALDGGYLKCVLYVNKTARNRYVHLLVCEAFHGPRPDGMEVRHLDGDKLNLAPSNLKWGTHAENMADIIAHGHWAGSRPACGRGHKYTPENTRLERGGKKRVCKTCVVERRQLKRAA